MKIFLLLFILAQIEIIYAENLEIGCNILSKHSTSCEEKNILQNDKNILKEEIPLTLTNLPKKKINLSTLLKEKKLINITKEFSSINIIYQKKNIKIIRKATHKNQSCPPSCIQPIHIKKIKTVGTLETLNFIKNLNKKKRMLLVDTRESLSYKKNTIPTAINIPYSILSKKSKHTPIILGLLGAIKNETSWSFNNVHKLLIFDNGSIDNQSEKTILRLIELGYPQNKILYYYGGLNEWEKEGLSTTID